MPTRKFPWQHTSAQRSSVHSSCFFSAQTYSCIRERRLVQIVWYETSDVLLVRSDELQSVFLAGVVDGLGQEVRLAPRSDRLLDLFLLGLVQTLGNEILKAKRDLGVLEQGTLLRVDLVFRDLHRATKVHVRDIHLGPLLDNGRSDPRIVIEGHIYLSLRSSSRRTTLEVEVLSASCRNIA